MQKNIMAIVTLIRNRLNNTATSYEEKMLFFHEKGITLSVSDQDLYFLKADPRGHVTDMSKIADNLIFRGAKVACFHGTPVQEMTLEESTNGNFLWNQNTIFIQKLDGHTLYLYWDMKKESWECSNDSKPVSPLKDLIIPQIYNLMSLDPRYTYELCFVQSGSDVGLFLVGMYDNKKCFELEWKKTDAFAFRHNLKRPPVFAFEGLEKIEESDLPIIAQDQTTTKIYITKLK